MKRGRIVAAAFAAVTVAGACWLLVLARMERAANVSLVQRMQGIVSKAAPLPVACAPAAQPRPLVLLALGQSNAANHGSAGTSQTDPITQFQNGVCFQSSDPLPGATGTGGSIWSRLPGELKAQSIGRPVVLVVLAVDATNIDDWTRTGSPLRDRLLSELRSLGKQQLQPDLILWQQGEADVRAGTSTRGYRESLLELQTFLQQAGLHAPIMLAYSTICRGTPSQAIRAGIDSVLALHSGFLRGPDTDKLDGPDFRRDGCHFSVQGLDAAARMWAHQVRDATRAQAKGP